MRPVETAHWKRISKAKARKLYNAGTSIMVVPHKVNPENNWGIGVITDIEYWDHPSFEKFLNEFVWYNCQYEELGKYPAYYERKETTC